MAELSAEDETLASLLAEENTSAVNAYLTKKSIEVPYPVLLLKNTEIVLQANAIKVLEMTKTGPICQVTDTSSYHSFWLRILVINTIYGYE